MRSTSLFLFIFTVTACTTDKQVDSSNDQTTDTRFQTCYYQDNFAQKQCDSVLISIFGKKHFDTSIRLNKPESTMNCQVDSTVKLLPFGNTDCCVPNSYELVFTINQKNETIYSFRMVAGEDMQFEPVSTIVTDQLRGYKQLLNGKFTVDYSKAKKIALANGANLEETDLELVSSTTTNAQGKNGYQWEAELDYDHNSVLVLHIDVLTGKTSTEVIHIDQLD
jgi:ribosomal protein L25 (general stress protein Ctc)